MMIIVRIHIEEHQAICKDTCVRKTDREPSTDAPRTKRTAFQRSTELQKQSKQNNARVSYLGSIRNPTLRKLQNT